MQWFKPSTRGPAPTGGPQSIAQWVMEAEYCQMACSNGYYCYFYCNAKIAIFVSKCD